MRLALRQFRRQPGFTIAVVLTLALGIGVNTAIFSVFNAIVLRPLSYADVDRLGIVWETNPALGMPTPGARIQASIQNFLEWKRANLPFEDLAAFADRDFNLTGVDMPEPVKGFRATANLFPMLGVRMSLGRTFSADEDSPGHEKVVLLSNRLWTRRFGSDPNIVGRELRLSDESYTVIGVLPPGFEEPPRWSGYRAYPDVWVPMAFTDAERSGATNYSRILYPVARLRSGVSVAQAHAEMDSLGRRLSAQFPDRNEGWSINFISVQSERVSERVRQSLLILLTAAGMVLLVACANIGNLMLARAAGRQREFAIRAALGASRMHIIRQLLTEALILGMTGGVLGLLLAYWTTPLLLSLQTNLLRRIDHLPLDWRVLGFSIGLTLACVIAFGLMPLRLLRPERLRQMPGHRLRSALLSAELAFALVLLIASGLLIKSLWKMLNVDVGLRAENVLTVVLTAKTQQFFYDLVPRLQSLPGVESVGIASHLPMQVLRAGRLRTGGMTAKEAIGVDHRLIGRNYFSTLRIPILQGRDFTQLEIEKGNVPIAIVDATLARRLNPTGQVIGMRVTSVDWKYCKESCEIVGVSGAIRQIGPEESPRPEILVPGVEKTNSLVIRTQGDPAAIAPFVRREIAAIDKNQAVGKMVPMKTSLDGTTEERRFNLTLTGIFTGLALVLAGIGIFGVTAFLVAQRTREIGIRVAIGARRRDIVRVVLTQSLYAIAIGTSIGLLVAIPVMQSIRRYFYQVEPGDVVAYVTASLMLCSVVLISVVIPLARAFRIDPAIALRHD